ncbi:Nitronate monooxygenase, partial [Tolypocladium paradoxum]
MAALRPVDFRRILAQTYPWVKSPFIVGAPMRVMAGPGLAVAMSSAGGLGFIGPQAKAGDVFLDLETAAALIPPASTLRRANPALLPVGIGFQTWNGDLQVATSAVQEHRPCAAWLFAPRRGQRELNEWTARLRQASPDTQVWIQVGTLREAVEAARSPTPPDVLVVQGAEAGGHG